MAKVKAGPTTALAVVKPETMQALSKKLKEQGLSLAGPRRAQQVQGATNAREGGTPWILFAPGKDEWAARAARARGNTPSDLGYAFIVRGESVVMLRGGAVPLPGERFENVGPLMFCLDAISFYGVSNADGDGLAEASWTKYTKPKTDVGKKKVGVLGRFYGLVLFVNEQSEWECSFFTCRTGIGRRDGFAKLLTAADLGKDEEWLAANPQLRGIPDDHASLRCGIEASFPVVTAGSYKWTGFKGTERPFPLSPDLANLVIDFLDKNLDQLPKLVEWLNREQADIEEVAGEPRPEASEEAEVEEDVEVEA